MANFELTYDKSLLKQISTNVLERSLSLGVSSSYVVISENIHTNVDVLNNDIENFENSYNSSLELVVYVGQKSGHVVTSQIEHPDIDGLIQNAIDIAKFTQEDNANGIAETKFLCQNFHENLELYNPIDLDNEYLIQKAQDIENLAINFDKKVKKSDGSSISLNKSNFNIATTNGFNAGYQTTRYGNSISLIGETPDGMQTDYWYSSARHFEDLLSDHTLAEKASKRVARRLNRGHIKTGTYSVIFENVVAKSLIGNFLHAISGNTLYRKLSFLNNSLNTKIFPSWLNIYEDPFIIRGLSSCYFDNEGVMVKPRSIVKEGFVTSYVLSSYSARKLNMTTTGNSGGNHNILVKSNYAGGITEMAKLIHSGLIIIDTIGHGLNMVTGDYSVGASGLIVENGEIQSFVDNLTIAGNLKEIFKNIQYIGNDYIQGSIQCGSMLVNNISIST